MTRKHFTAMAEILATNDAPMKLVDAMMDYFATQNDNFNPDRFFDYYVDMKNEVNLIRSQDNS